MTHTTSVAERPPVIPAVIPAVRPKATAAEATIVTSIAGRRSLAVLRLATGFIFLWAFLDKTFGLGFSTLTKSSWINGGAPSQGFLKSPAVSGPLKGLFAAIASPTSDILFMLAMLAVGIAVMAGIGLRVSAVAGTVVLLFMYLAEWPFTANAASTNPLVDYHIIYALALIVIAFLSAGDTWGFGRSWKRLTLVKNNRWLI
jgi:thiosulfate dehydrogenase [quinone] large subunit